MKQLIFVVETETEVRELARHCLEEAGYVVRTFSTANVIQEAEDKHPALMLITMPFDGLVAVMGFSEIVRCGTEEYQN
jgi:CheY-like chemotaxis protein